jgi:prolyl-tRNA synthetase
MAKREFNVSKKEKFAEWYNTIIYAADLVDNRYNVQGFVVHKPWAMYSFRALYALFEKELEANGHEPVLFPAVIPEDNFRKEAQHVEGFAPQVFWITQGGAEQLTHPLALRPTSETAFYQMYSKWVQSQSDLPLKFYQSCTVFRYEHETLPFMRGREFMWIEAHDAFASEKEAKDQVKQDIEIGQRVLNEVLGLPLICTERPAWDTFPGAEHTYAYDVLMPDGRVNQVASTHLLGQKFAKTFDIEFKDDKGEAKHAWQTCFGPGIWRIMAALVSVHGDDRGLIFPFAVAPAQVVIVTIPAGDAKEDKKILDYAAQLRDRLALMNIRAVIDNTAKTPGFKFNYWEMRGVPIRMEVGKKEVEKNAVTIARRDTKARAQVPLDALTTYLVETAGAILLELKARAKEDFNKRLKDAKTKEEVKKILEEDKGIARTTFCTTGEEGHACADELAAFAGGAKVRGTLVDKEEKPEKDAKCIVCGKPAKAIVYVAKQY